MTATNDTYSRFIKIVKYILSVIAICLFASIFIFSKKDAIRDGSIFTSVEMKKLAIGQKITNPHFSGLTETGQAFNLSAKEALPNAQKPNIIILEFPHAEFTTDDGISIISKATKGKINIQKRLATLTGDVSFDMSNGYSAQSEHLEFNLKTGSALSPGKIIVNGPFGSIEAGNLSLTQNFSTEDKMNSAVLLFKNGVKLIYKTKDSKLVE